MTQKVTAHDLRIGMFVADLDRPWIDTPFLLQGFLIEDEEQLAQLRRYCEWALVDPQRSVGDEFAAKAPARPAPPRPAAPAEPKVTVVRAADPTPPTKAPPPAPAREAAPRREGAEHASSHGLAPARPPVRPPSRPEFSPPPAERGPGLFGKFRQRMSGLFARDAAEEPDDAVATDEVPEPATEPGPPPRPAFIPESVVLTYYETRQPVEEEIGAATVAFEKTNEVMSRVVEDIRAGKALALESVEDVLDDMVESMMRNPDALMWVARLREKTQSVYDHGLSVAVSLVAFGRHLGYPKAQLAELGLMGLLLDVGKIKLPQELLEKNARLSSEEFELIKDHVELGLEVLAGTPNIHPDVLTGIAQHHERMNGTGYPYSLMGDKISVFGRMAAIGDTYAAVTHRRPYAEAVSPHEALQMLTNWSGTQFQADMVEQFIQSIGVFPVGSLVELSTGEVAVIVSHNRVKRLRPKVLVVTNADKSHCDHPAMRDLLYDVSDKPAYIRRGLAPDAYGLDASEFYLT